MSMREVLDRRDGEIEARYYGAGGGVGGGGWTGSGSPAGGAGGGDCGGVAVVSPGGAVNRPPLGAAAPGSVRGGSVAVDSSSCSCTGSGGGAGGATGSSTGLAGGAGTAALA